MNSRWKPVPVFIPASLSDREVLERIEAQIRVVASEAGDFVLRIHVGTGEPHDDEWTRWSAAYLPGPPSAFPVPQQDHAITSVDADFHRSPRRPAK